MEQLSKAKAIALDKRLRLAANKTRDSVQLVAELLEQAQAGNIWKTLGFRSWPSYVQDALKGKINVDKTTRQALVAIMTGDGMSQNAIAEALGTTRDCVRGLEEMDVILELVQEVHQKVKNLTDNNEYGGDPQESKLMSRVSEMLTDTQWLVNSLITESRERLMSTIKRHRMSRVSQILRDLS